MARSPRALGANRPRPPSPARIHNDWLKLVEVSGPFLSIPVLLRVFPHGPPRGEETPQLRKDFRVQLATWEEGARDPAAQQAFLRFVLERVLEWPAEQLKAGQVIPPGLDHLVAEHGETLRPDLVLVNPQGHSSAGKARVLVLVHPAEQDLERPLEHRRWKASPGTRAMQLCHATGVPLALVTNGDAWMLVHARPRETTTFATFTASLFGEEAGLFDAFRALLDRRRLFGVADADSLEALLAESAANQQEVTDQLGLQVRRAVEVLVQALDRADREAGGAILRGVPERTLYEAAVGVMMRLVFTLAAEERKLLPAGDPLYDAHYGVSTLLGQLQEVADQRGVEVLERRFAAWARLLAGFRAIHGGVDHDRLRLPAYGGSLYDPDRYPFLEGRAPGTSWREAPASPVKVSDRTVLDLLQAIQVLELPVPGGGKEARRLSFRALDVEQIGHVYEGLLDHTAVRATETVLGLGGAKGKEPELPLSAFSMARDRGEDHLVGWLVEETGKSESALKKAIGAAEEADLEATARLLQACANDEQLRDAVRPWARLLRKDPAGFPVVIRKGSVFVTAGQDRRSAGAHYTPRSLTEPVVQYALEPQVYRGPAEGWPRGEWKLKSPRELLALRVCDLAMGSGAFLAQACRWLAERLVEAWEEAEAAAGGKLVVTPEGDVATGAPGERPLPRSAEERLALARRAVAERCLYGVDINPMAVEIAKLSLWLVTLQKDRPFTFVDHALRCGDSLLGLTSPEQIIHFHLDPEKGKQVHQKLVSWTAACEPALKSALEKRQKLESFTVERARDAEEKERLLAEAEAALADVRLVADAVVAAALATAGKGETAYADQLVSLSRHVSVMFDPKAQAEAVEGAKRQLGETVGRLMNEGKPIGTPPRRPFHWVLEFPEVMNVGTSDTGFESVIGNPPFLGGKKLSGILGSDVREYLVDQVAEGRKGNADLCAYFFLRAFLVCGPGGTLGLVATNSVAQGETLEVGLRHICERDCSIYRAIASSPWPGAASLEIAHSWLVRGLWKGERFLGTRKVEAISESLDETGRVAGVPRPLAKNFDRAYQGTVILGIGFALSRQEVADILTREPQAGAVLKPYLNAEDLNSSLDHAPSRMVIDFQAWPLDRQSAPSDYRGDVAEDFPVCLGVVRERVLPDRQRSKRDRYRSVWWQFGERQASIYAHLEGKTRALVIPLVSKYMIACWQPTGMIFAHALGVVCDDADEVFGAIQSSAHEAWARKWGSSLKDFMRYTPTGCFETFPFPEATVALRVAGASYWSVREAACRELRLGLTDVYNRVHDSGCTEAPIRDLRQARQELDSAVSGAYAWTDLDLGHDFHQTKQGIRFTISESARREVLARLLKLNHERYAEEVKQGLHETAKKGGGGKKGKPKGSDPEGGPQGTLF